MIDGRSIVTQGRGPIVLRVENGYGFHEHGTIGQAKAEAARLAQIVGGAFVVYVPVAKIEPAPKVITTNLLPEAPDGFPHPLEDDDYPSSSNTAGSVPQRDLSRDASLGRIPRVSTV